MHMRVTLTQGHKRSEVEIEIISEHYKYIQFIWQIHVLDLKY